MVLLSDKHPINLTIGQELPPTFHYAWVILVNRATAESQQRTGHPPPSPLAVALESVVWRVPWLSTTDVEEASYAVDIPMAGPAQYPCVKLTVSQPLT